MDKIHRKTLQHFPINPLQKNTHIPFEMFNAPLKIREDLELNRKTKQPNKKNRYHEVTDPSDIFEVGGRPAETIYMLGKAGRGKTGQCYQLIQHWVEAREAKKEKRELSKWQKSLFAFDFLFFVSLRHVDEGMHSVVEIICRSSMKTFPLYHDTIHQLLTSGLHTCKCLIVIDGLDERKGMVDIDVDMSRCTVLMTSRHWKFHDLKPAINDRDRLVEVCGLDFHGVNQVIEKILVNYFGLDNKSTEFTTKAKEISKAARDEKYKSIIHIPLLLTAFVHLWQSNTSLQDSLTSFYVALLNRLVKEAYDNNRATKINYAEQSTTKVVWPIVLVKHRTFREHFKLLLSLGKVAYEDLVLGNQKHENQEKEKYKGRQREGTSQLVFEKDDLIDKLGIEVLKFALEVGLLSQSSAPGSFDDENVSINFFHKTIEEFLAALFLVCSEEVSFNSFFISCSGMEKIMELSNILAFSVGLQPNLGSVISNHIAHIASSDRDIIKYRQGVLVDKNSDKVKVLFKILCDCNQEMKYMSQSETKKQSNTLRVSDVYVQGDPNDSTIVFANELLSREKDNVVSLHVDYCFGKVSLPFKIVNEFLDKTSSLQALYLTGREIRGTLCSISPVFSSLTTLSLQNISLTNEAATALQKSIQTNTKIQSLKLGDLDIEQNASGTQGDVNGVFFARTDRSEISLDMKTNLQLRILSLETQTITSANILLVDITQCKSLINLNLKGVQVKSVDMIQASLSSFTQLENLTLNSVSFSNDTKEQIRLDLTSIPSLKTLNFTSIHVASIKISPDSLRGLTISNVSGSLRDLLLCLPKCQHLTDLCIDSLDNEQDIKLLTNVLPRLSQVRNLKVGMKWRMGNEVVAEYHSALSQAVTRMTGLERVCIHNIDMGNFALTLTPLMTRIKEVKLWEVQMTASSWVEFIASVLTIQHGFDIVLLGTNIDDQSVSAVHSSPHFKVTKQERGKYSSLHFSKLSS